MEEKRLFGWFMRVEGRGEKYGCLGGGGGGGGGGGHGGRESWAEGERVAGAAHLSGLF